MAFSSRELKLDRENDTIQNKNATTKSASNCLPKNSGSRSGINLPTLSKSVSAIINTSEVSLNIAINVLTKAGITTLIACGKTILIVESKTFNPKAFAASN